MAKKNKNKSKKATGAAKASDIVKAAQGKAKATAKKSAVLDNIKVPAKLGDASIAFETKVIKAAVASAVDSLAMARDSMSEQQEPSIMLAFDNDDSCNVIFARSSGGARVTVPARIFNKGKDHAFVVPVSLFRAVSGETVTLTVFNDKDQIVFNSGAVTGNIQIPSTIGDYASALPLTVPKAVYELPTSVVDTVVSKLMFPSFDPMLTTLGLPLHILVRKGKLMLSSNDSLAGAMYTLDDVKLDKLDVVIPGQALVKIAKLTKADTIRLGFEENLFRIKTPEIDVTHPAGTYDLFDIRGFIADDEKETPDYELMLPTVALLTAIEGVIGISVLEKGEGNKVSLEFEADGTGKARFIGNVAQARNPFKITKVLKKAREMTIITDGRRLVSFISMMKHCTDFRLRVHNNRAFMYSPDNSLVFMLPLA